MSTRGLNGRQLRPADPPAVWQVVGQAVDPQGCSTSHKYQPKVAKALAKVQGSGLRTQDSRTERDGEEREERGRGGEARRRGDATALMDCSTNAVEGVFALPLTHHQHQHPGTSCSLGEQAAFLTGRQTSRTSSHATHARQAQATGAAGHRWPPPHQFQGLHAGAWGPEEGRRWLSDLAFKSHDVYDSLTTSAL